VQHQLPFLKGVRREMNIVNQFLSLGNPISLHPPSREIIFCPPAPLFFDCIVRMAQQAKQAAQRLGGMFPQGSGKGLGSAAGALVVLGALGYGVNASLFNGKIE
jgi:hypothetical protein